MAKLHSGCRTGSGSSRKSTKKPKAKVGAAKQNADSSSEAGSLPKLKIRLPPCRDDLKKPAPPTTPVQQRKNAIHLMAPSVLLMNSPSMRNQNGVAGASRLLAFEQWKKQLWDELETGSSPPPFTPIRPTQQVQPNPAQDAPSLSNEELQVCKQMQVSASASKATLVYISDSSKDVDEEFQVLFRNRSPFHTAMASTSAPPSSIQKLLAPPPSEPQSFPITTFVNVEGPPVLKKGKTVRGNKMVPGEKVPHGLFTTTDRDSYLMYLGSLAKCVGAPVGCLRVETMKWWGAKGVSKSDPFSLSTEAAYVHLITRLQTDMKVHKGPAIASIHVHIMELKDSQELAPDTVGKHLLQDTQACLESSGLLWKFVILDSYIGNTHSGDKKLPVDALLKGTVDWLNDMYKIGTCYLPAHKSLCCVQYELQDWHLELTLTCAQVWAQQIICEKADYCHIPIRNQFFKQD
ncbi:hypothetical protein WG66_004577 [Moniliophthora roreri]|nr:hypothetical protein WG66_004577 [Moniliophthora roreri]